MREKQDGEKIRKKIGNQKQIGNQKIRNLKMQEIQKIWK